MPVSNIDTNASHYLNIIHVVIAIAIATKNDDDNYHNKSSHQRKTTPSGGRFLLTA